MDLANLEKKCLELANSLVVRYAANSNRVRNVRAINSDLIVLLFESITKHNIPDLLTNDNKEAEAHNVQAVIDTLSLDLLGISLSHITGEDVVAGNLTTIYNLLEVLEGVATYLKSKKQFQPRIQNRIIKRKIRRKISSSSTSVKSLKSLQQYSPDIETITQIEHIVRRKTYEKKSSSSTSIESLKSSVHDSPVFDANNQDKIHLDRPPSSTSYESRPLDAQKQDSYQFQTRSKQKDGSNIHLSTTGIISTHEYPRSKTSLSPPPQLQHEKVNYNTNFEQQLQHANSGSKTGRNESKSEVEKINVSTKEKPAFVERNLKRKIHKLPKKENIEPSSSLPQEVEELYGKNFETKVRGLLEKNSYKSRASQLKNVHLQTVRKPLKKLPISACKKSFLLPHTLRRRSVSHNAMRRKASRKSRTHQNIPSHKEVGWPESRKEGFMQELFDEFPGLQLTPAITNHITNKYQQHLLKMHKQVKAILLKKPKTQMQAEEASKKQALLSDIIKKDIQQQQHLKELKEQKKFENKIKYKLRDARLQSAKMKQYCDEFQTEMRKKMRKRNYSEELVFENVFKESLKIQKEQVDYLCQEVKETGDADARQHLVYLEALENLYRTQFSMLSESLADEQRDYQVRAKAEQQEMNAMQREFQDELKHEIRFMQKVIVDCMEDIHFREMDAEQFKMKLRKRQ